MKVATLAFQALVRVFTALAPHLAKDDALLPLNDERWTGATRLRAEFEKFCTIPPDISADEYRRRFRAFGEGPFKDLNTTIHGHRFVLETNWTEADLAKEMGSG